MPDSHRCRLCTANDHEALVHELATRLWESRRHGSPDDVPFERAGSYWQRVFLELAETAVAALRH